MGVYGVVLHRSSAFWRTESCPPLLPTIAAHKDTVPVRLPRPLAECLSRSLSEMSGPCSCSVSVLRLTGTPAWQACAPTLAIVLGLSESMWL